MLLNDYYILMQKYSISQLRQNKDYLLFCKCASNHLDNLQKVSSYMLDMINIDKAEGIWLDYLGWLVGTTREYFNIARFFSVNNADLNEKKYFWFKDQTIGQISNLNDDLFRRRIYAKIGYNTTKGRREDNIYILKNMTNADKVIIKRNAPMARNIILIGNNILETNRLLDDIESVLPTGVGLNRLYLNPTEDELNNIKGAKINAKTRKTRKLAA